MLHSNNIYTLHVVNYLYEINSLNAILFILGLKFDSKVIRDYIQHAKASEANFHPVLCGYSISKI